MTGVREPAARRRNQPLLPAPAARVLHVTAAVAAVVVVLLGVLNAGHTEPGWFDAWVQPAATRSVGAAWSAAIAVDFLGEPRGSVTVVVVLAVLFAVLRRWRVLALALAGPGLTIAVTALGKPLADRTIHTVYLSYPSGHTAFVTAVTLAVAMPLAGRLRAGPVVVLACALVTGAYAGWAQVGLSAHYATDAIGGFCTAVAVVPATATLIDRIWRRTATGPRPGQA
ncbi:undecaprenyl-diphosphatase [Amycolatopsis viridis]|uniref:Undecaprenyl-diphosphatase n=1 Tax=Amycolatopsis viridis TaxID=185678 RepID=A0ABX0T5E4_9PSEU|nr:undecaprenyl-diphosphatase [Amycolatopsis viridis]